MSRSVLLGLLAPLAVAACARAASGHGAEASAPARAVAFRVDYDGQGPPEHLAGVAYVYPSRIAIAVTDAVLAPDAPDARLRQVRPMLVKTYPGGGWDIAEQGEAVPVARLRALDSRSGDTVWFEIRHTGKEPLAQRRLSFLVESQLMIPGRGEVAGTRPLHGTQGLLAAP